MADEIVRKKLSVRQVEEQIQQLKTAAPASPAEASQAKLKAPKGRPVWVQEIEDTLSEAVGAPVTVRYGRKRSRIQIECGPREDFERIYEKLKGLQA